jgi:ubiquinone biosynthesis protein
VGWRGLLERLGNEAPRYAQMLPELPRLLHQALRQQGHQPDTTAVAALLAEQRRTNRLLQGVLWVVVACVLGWLALRSWAV